MQNATVTNADLRRKAREIIRLNLPALAMVIFLAELPGLISSTFNTLTLDSSPVLTNILQLLVKTENAELTLAQFEEQSLDILRTFVTGSPFIIAAAVRLVSLAVTPVLTLGLLASLLRLARGESVTASDVFCRRRLFFRSIGLEIMIILKEILWMLPGMAVYVLSVVLYGLTGSEFLLDLLAFGGSALMIWLGVRAAMSYAMSELVMADLPEKGIRASIRRSTEIMNTRRMNLLAMYLLFIALNLALSWVESLLLSMLPVIGLVIGLVLDLLLSLYMEMSFTYYYLRETDGRLPEIGKEEAKTMNE